MYVGKVEAVQQLVAELQLPLLACTLRPLPRGRDCISHPWFSSKCYTRLGACTRAPERPCLCGVYGLVQVTGSKQMTHKYTYDHEMRQGPGMIRTVCWGQNSRDNLISVGCAGADGSGRNEASSSPVQSRAGGWWWQGQGTLSTHFSLDVWGTERRKTPPI